MICAPVVCWTQPILACKTVKFSEFQELINIILVTQNPQIFIPQKLAYKSGPFFFSESQFTIIPLCTQMCQHECPWECRKKKTLEFLVIFMVSSCVHFIIMFILWHMHKYLFTYVFSYMYMHTYIYIWLSNMY